MTDWLTDWLTDFLELSSSWEVASCAAAQELPGIMEAEGLVPCSQEPSTGPYPEPDYISPYHLILPLKYPF
jgi:hypothetical protein